MKNAKLLKSAVLSTALLFVGGAQAQTSENGATAITVQAVASIGVTAGNLSFGTHNVPSVATNVTLSCGSAGAATIAPAAISGGNCGVVGVTTSSTSNVTYNVSIAATALALSGTNLATSNIVVYDTFGDEVIPQDALTVSSSSAGSFWVGGTVAVPANTAAGTYTGTYTFTATIS